VPWPEIFLVFLVCHFSGDFLLQTEWQATRKRGGLGPDPVARRALVTHVLTYTLAFVPAFVWLADDLGPAVLGVALLIAGPHLVQDDGRLIEAYMARVKHALLSERPGVGVMVDQSFHLVALFAVALVAAS
jgi:Protein of unknown function (DUF3307)